LLNLRLAVNGSGCGGKLRHVCDAIAESTAGNGEVQIEFPVRGVVRVERHAEKALFT
jgi:hypothetical protein